MKTHEAPTKRRNNTLRSHRSARRDESGIAMVTVVIILMVMALLSIPIMANLSSELNGVHRQRNITTALSAADAGVDDLVFQLSQGTNWNGYQAAYNSAAAWSAWSVVGKGRYRFHIDCVVASDCAQVSNQRVLTVQGQYPTGSAQTRKIQAVVQQQAPAGLGFAMFSDTGVDIHHHNGSYISPTIVTTQIHSNGYINLDYPATYRVGSMEAATTIDIGKGGGTTPSGSVTAPYNWAYTISAGDSTNPPRCYPSLTYPAQPADAAISGQTEWNIPSNGSCPLTPAWSPHALVIGDVRANKVTVGPMGATQQPTGASWTPESTGTCSQTQQPGLIDPVTGACIVQGNSNIDAGSVTLSASAKTWTGPSSGNAVTVHYKAGATPPAGSTSAGDCTLCNQGTTDTAGGVGGFVNVHPSGWTPGTIQFPSLNYRAVNYPLAVADQGGSASSCSGVAPATTTCHVFPTPSGLTPGNQSFTTWMADTRNVYHAIGSYATNPHPCPSGIKCMVWLDANQNYTTTPANVASVVLTGTYFITTGNNLSLTVSGIRSGFATPTGAPTPTILVKGSVVVEKGTMSAQTNLTIVGETMDPFNPAASGVPSNTIPGLLAVGGTISATDDDTDSPWTSTGQYQPTDRSTTIVRGLVYAGIWNSASGTSTAQNQHWHDEDPKNATIIMGAQAGADLHDCNDFTFSYDPLVSNIPGFTGGGGNVFVVSWHELGN